MMSDSDGAVKSVCTQQAVVNQLSSSSVSSHSCYPPLQVFISLCFVLFLHRAFAAVDRAVCSVICSHSVNGTESDKYIVLYCCYLYSC